LLHLRKEASFFEDNRDRKKRERSVTSNHKKAGKVMEAQPRADFLRGRPKQRSDRENKNKLMRGKKKRPVKNFLQEKEKKEKGHLRNPP